MSPPEPRALTAIATFLAALIAILLALGAFDFFRRRAYATRVRPSVVIDGYEPSDLRLVALDTRLGGCDAWCLRPRTAKSGCRSPKRSFHAVVAASGAGDSSQSLGTKGDAMRTAAVKRVIVLATILALAIGAGSSGAETTQRVPEKYSFVTIDYPGSVWTTLSAINNNGQVVGDYSLTHGIDAGKNVRSFVRSLKQGRSVSFTMPKGRSNTSPLGINDAGQVVGWYYDARGKGHGYVRSADGGLFRTVDHPRGVVETSVIGINNKGLISGFYIDGRKRTHGFVQAVDGGPFTEVDHPGAGQTFALRIDDRGQVAGFYRDKSGVTHAFVRSANGRKFTDFDHPLADGTTCAQFVNKLDVVAGFYRGGDKLFHGYVRSADGTFNSIEHPKGAGGTMVFGMNDAGRVVGFYTDAKGVSHGFIGTPQR